jgi:hypothetical protein
LLLLLSLAFRHVPVFTLCAAHAARASHPISSHRICIAVNEPSRVLTVP